MATDYYQLRIQGLHETQYNECVLHFRGTNLTAADYMLNAADLCSSFQTEMQTAWLDCLPGTYQLLRLTAKKASAGGGGETSIQYDVGAAPGNVASTAASQQLCPAILLIPGMGVSSAGKVFMPCIAESQIQANVPSGAYLTAIDNLFVTMIGGFTGTSIVWDQVIYSRKNATFNPVVDYSVSPIVGFQRRRQRMNL